MWVIRGEKDCKLALYPFITSVCFIPSEPSDYIQNSLKLRPKTFVGTKREKMEDKCDVFVYLYATFRLINDLFWVAGRSCSHQLWVEHVSQKKLVHYTSSFLITHLLCWKKDSFHLRLTMNYELACLFVMVPQGNKIQQLGYSK